MFLQISWSNVLRFLTLVSVISSLEGGTFPGLVAQAQLSQNPNSESNFTPPKSDAPEDTAGGSTRDGGYCTQDSVAEGARGFTVLTPAYIETNADRPTFSLYIPRTVAKKVFFSLKDANEEYYYRTTISLPSTLGEFKFQLPNDAPPIKAGKEYTWSLGLICQQTLDPNDPVVTGTIKRVGQKSITQNLQF